MVKSGPGAGTDPRWPIRRPGRIGHHRWLRSSSGAPRGMRTSSRWTRSVAMLASVPAAAGGPATAAAHHLTKYRQGARRSPAVINAGQTTTLTELSAAEAQRGAPPRLLAL